MINKFTKITILMVVCSFTHFSNAAETIEEALKADNAPKEEQESEDLSKLSVKDLQAKLDAMGDMLDSHHHDFLETEEG